MGLRMVNLWSGVNRLPVKRGGSSLRPWGLIASMGSIFLGYPNVFLVHSFYLHLSVFLQLHPFMDSGNEVTFTVVPVI